MRLGNTIARQRLHYRRPLPTLPDVCLIDIPQPYASPSLPLGRYYPVIIETDVEWREWDRFLNIERQVPVAPDLFDRRPSVLRAGTITFAHYDPAASGCQRIRPTSPPSSSPGRSRSGTCRPPS
ncbi:hypothetical protein [Sphingomonas sp. T9W2]|uniref:hypothetical protein n=1 Tax=Sphingomonas sp. T9W2 TaxID=3143183 RepID=UPI0031F58338